MGRRERLLKLRASKVSERRSYISFAILGFAIAVLLMAVVAAAQDELPRGSIQGVIVDPAGAPIVGATVNIYSKQTETSAKVTTDTEGKYDSGPLPKGTYAVRVESRNFRINRFALNVRDGQTTNGDRKMVAIDPGAPTLEGNVSPSEIEKYPIDGRDVLGLTQFEPGILVQDGRSVDATKTGNLATSVDRISGLATLQTLDGVSINDETNGGVTQNVAQSTVQELQVSRSALDVSVG